MKTYEFVYTYTTFVKASKENEARLKAEKELIENWNDDGTIEEFMEVKMTEC